MRNVFAIAAAVLWATTAVAHDFKVGDLAVTHPYSFETTQTARSGAGYFEVQNTGDTTDRLIAVEADFPRVMIHQTVVTDGVAKMEHIMGGVEIAPGAVLSFAPGGYHVMFMGLDGDPFELGEAINATLVFENAGTLDVVFEVEARPDASAAATHDH